MEETESQQPIALQEVFDEFQAAVDEALARAGSTIRRLAAEVEVAPEKIESVWWDQIDEMKVALASAAADLCCADSRSRRKAVNAAEAWVAANVSNGGYLMWVAAVFVQNGDRAGEELIRLSLATAAPAPHP
jgi:hypothetical protein